MKRRQVNSFNILSPEDKQYLRRVCRYINSLGMKSGTIEIEMDRDNYNFDFSDIDWAGESTFTNNYSIEIPDGIAPILTKISNYIQQNNLFGYTGVDDATYERLEVEIDCEKQELSFLHWWNYYDRGDSSTKEWVDKDGEEIFDAWETDDSFQDLTIPDDGILTLSYNGSGDSGFIESSFDVTDESVPSEIEDWCYRELENNYGGWEINEGSDGQFIFDFNNKTIELIHTYNLEETATDTIYEESFAE